jgi:hypothetical protein
MHCVQAKKPREINNHTLKHSQAEVYYIVSKLPFWLFRYFKPSFQCYACLMRTCSAQHDHVWLE